MARQTERRSHLDVQVGMLSEQELTTILQMLQKLCHHMGVNVDSSKQEVQAFSKTTDVHKLASELHDKLPGGMTRHHAQMSQERLGSVNPDARSDAAERDSEVPGDAA
jgi:uncharacterized membrane protein